MRIMKKEEYKEVDRGQDQYHLGRQTKEYTILCSKLKGKGKTRQVLLGINHIPKD